MDCLCFCDDDFEVFFPRDPNWGEGVKVFYNLLSCVELGFCSLADCCEALDRFWQWLQDHGQKLYGEVPTDIDNYALRHMYLCIYSTFSSRPALHSKAARYSKDTGAKGQPWSDDWNIQWTCTSLIICQLLVGLQAALRQGACLQDAPSLLETRLESSWERRVSRAWLEFVHDANFWHLLIWQHL